jgi:phosphoribosylformylglycinamidine synthase
MARMALGEALTNLAAAPIRRWADIKLQANWMWPGREGPAAAALYHAVEALTNALLALGLALDGGKDSLSMATDAGADGRIPSPPTVVLTAYAPCVDVGRVLTPDVKVPSLQEEGEGEGEGEEGVLVHVDLGGRQGAEPRLGGSALAQVMVADEDGGEGGRGEPAFARPPDMDDPALVKRAFEAVQRLQQQELIQAMHDVSAGGLVATVLEMALAGDAGARVVVPPSSRESSAARGWLFGEELGWVLEVRRRDLPAVEAALDGAVVPRAVIGASTRRREFVVVAAAAAAAAAAAGGEKEGEGEVLLREEMGALRAAWEATSLKLERLQANPACVAAEERSVQCVVSVSFVDLAGGPSECIMSNPPRPSPHNPRLYPNPPTHAGAFPTNAAPGGTSPSAS